MDAERLLYALTGIRDSFIREAAPGAAVPRRRKWPWAAALAACLCLALLIARAWPAAPAESGTAGPGDESPADTEPPPEGCCDMVPSLTVDGVTYYASGRVTRAPECPEGFTYAGETTVTYRDDPVPYYTNPERPEWVYVYQECWDLLRQEPYMAYARYVKEGLHELDLLRYQGELYVSLSDIHSLSLSHRTGAYPEDLARYDSLPYTRILQDPPDGFEPVGKTVYDGDDLVPTSELGSNRLPGQQVLANPAEPDILLRRYYQSGLSGPEYWVFVRYP